MTSKQYLSKYRKYMADIVFFETMREQALYNVASLKSPQFGDKVQTSPENDPIGNLVIEYERDVAKYTIEILSCKAKMVMIDNQICQIRQVNEDFYKILSYRYMVGLDWQEIANKMYMGLSTVTHLHCPALKKFEEMFGEHYINA
jgi:hypothetical protein